MDKEQMDQVIISVGIQKETKMDFTATQTQIPKYKVYALQL